MDGSRYRTRRIMDRERNRRRVLRAVGGERKSVRMSSGVGVLEMPSEWSDQSARGRLVYQPPISCGNTNRRVWYLHEGGKCGKMRMRIQETKVYHSALRQQCRAGMVFSVPHNTDGVCDTPECNYTLQRGKLQG